jgi:hypothetical protein
MAYSTPNYVIMAVQPRVYFHTNWNQFQVSLETKVHEHNLKILNETVYVSSLSDLCLRGWTEN